MVGKITFISGIYQNKVCYFKSAVSFGRNELNEICLPFPSISREHARISIRSGDYYIRDLKSNNGTFLNGKIIKDKEPINSGDKIQVGNFKMKFELFDDNEVDPSLITNKMTSILSTPHDTATGFMDIKDLNISDIENI